ncbi:hypothetical protein [Lacrimispora amygdalina]|uniref:hypothetical protein n=1 Tax=Lacrimispora amygdalina TaxID=253257 RepID=UPI0014790249|nr:hypothetical protein [Clostridium indicum]
MLHELKIVDGKLYLDEKKLSGVQEYTISVSENSDRCTYMSELNLKIAIRLTGIERTE